MTKLENGESIDKINLVEYETISKLDFLSKEVHNQETIKSFFQEDNANNIYIQPFYINNDLKGYIKFIYQIPGFNMQNIFVLSEICLLVLEIFIMIILIYMKKKVIEPFQRLSELSSSTC